MNPDSILELMMRQYQAACVLGAAAELDLFAALAPRPLTAREAARKLKCDTRATAILLDALAALRLLSKRGDRYAVPRDVAVSVQKTLPMLQHQANCLRRWAELARTVKAGTKPEQKPSVRGAAGDRESFIGAMHVINEACADTVVRGLKCRRLLDVGGGSGTWTIAMLRANPGATATLFDLPPVIPLARRRLVGSPVKFVAGDFYRDKLPGGADLVWVSAIVHQNSRAQNRALFAKARRALVPGGRIAIRDIVMERSRTAPVSGALFAVNMLVATEGGGTFTLAELREDLEAAGFVGVTLARRDEGMNSIVIARKE